MPQASEEIKDPHNFLIRALTELGIVGAAMFLAWLMRAWWEWTTPVDCDDRGVAPDARKTVRGIALTCAIAVAINAAASIDFAQEATFVVLELLRRALYLLLLIAGCMVIVLRGSSRVETDARPAPWITRAMVVALAIFLLHNAIDFSLFEPSGLMIFALAGGAVSGAQTIDATRQDSRIAARLKFAIALIAWLIMGGVVVVPLLISEQHGARADDAIRAGHIREAVAQYTAALDASPLSDYQYAVRAVHAMAKRAPDQAMLAMADRAVTGNPLDPGNYLLRAQLWPRNDAGVEKDLSTAQRLNPSDVQIHLALAYALERAGTTDSAIAALERAITANAALEHCSPLQMRYRAWGTLPKQKRKSAPR